MRLRLPFVLLPSFALGCCAMLSASHAQQASTQHRVAHVEDGGMNEVLESIAIPSTPHAPFYATLDTEWARPLTGGGSYTFQNERHIARDSFGRVYQERWYLVPKNGKIKTQMYYIQIFDLVAHTSYWCNVPEKVCALRPYNPPPEVTFGTEVGEKGVLPDGWGFVTQEDLGKRNLNGVDTSGVRETRTINPWMVGNDRPMEIIREYWHSAALNINLLSTISDPRMGTQNFTITEISTSEPDAQLFLPPTGYKIVDQRNYTAAEP
ncbi:MAG TPA: hypothetical protein VE178_06725 [Silvibacterium sp.]|nr:hypothetical protein [Silvibacterium sp.]